MEKTIEIPDGYEARIEGNKVILEPNDEEIRSFLYEFIKICGWSEKNFPSRERCLAYLERQKEQKPHWKPSEKQMEELEYGIGLLGNMNVANALRELYSDLKKL